MVSKFIVGIEPFLSQAAAQWSDAEPGISFSKHEIKLDREYKFNLDFLASYSPSEVTGFVAWGNDFLNFQRWELVGELKKRGFRMPSLIHPSVVCATEALIGENSWIMPQAAIFPDVKIGLNCVIGFATNIGTGVFLSNNVWIGSYSTIGHKCVVNSHVTIGDFVRVNDGIKIGRYAIRELPTHIKSDVSDRSFSLSQGSLFGNIFDYGI